MKSIMGETGERRRPGMNDSRSYYKSQHSIMAKDQADLKNQIEELKRENLGLKKSLFDLSMRHEAALAQLEASSRHAVDLGAIVGSGGAPGGAPGRADEPVPVGRGAFREPSQETPSWSEKERRAVDERAGSRQFGWDYDLKGHTGAVYAVRWSPCGSFLASGSFDKTVRVWSVSGEVQRELLCLNEHQLNVSDVEWSADSQRLVSSSFDQTVKEWDVKGAALLRSHDVGGLGQCVAYDPGDEQLIYVGTTHKQVQIIDRRQPDLQNALLKNESIVNTVAVQAAGRVLISGDQEGYLKTWDLRTLGCVHQRHNDEQHKPISHIEVCHPRHAMRPSADGRDRDDLALGEHGRYLGVNSYDNVMRVYDRWCAAGPLRSAAAATAAAESEAAAADGETSPQKMGPGGGTGMAGQQHGVAMGAPGMGGRSNVIATPPRRGTDRGSGNDSGEGTSPPQHDGVGEGGQGLRTSPKLDRGGMNGGGGGERGNSGSSGHDSVTHGLMCTMKGHKNKVSAAGTGQ
jgi:COMPASS component SWD3